nr:hypothetical protein [Tanacetum cinerariifolium]
MLIFSKSSEFLWAETISTACFTQNCSLIHTSVEDQETPPAVSSSEDHLSPILSNDVVELVQEDSTDFNGNTLFTPYDALTVKEVESSSIAADPSYKHEFH